MRFNMKSLMLVGMAVVSVFSKTITTKVNTALTTSTSFASLPTVILANSTIFANISAFRPDIDERGGLLELLAF